jgi:hypothetical protein
MHRKYDGHGGCTNEGLGIPGWHFGVPDAPVEIEPILGMSPVTAVCELEPITFTTVTGHTL